MKNAENCFFIEQVVVRTTRNGNGIVDERHIRCDDDLRYYQASEKTEVRYRIWSHHGSMEDPSSLYRTPLEKDVFYASGHLRPTHQYLRKLDQTYFKFYDDAESVMHNIISFLQWLKNPPKKLLETSKFQKILKKYQPLITKKTVSAEWGKTKALQDGLRVKRRDALTRLQREIQDEMDLVPVRDWSHHKSHWRERRSSRSAKSNKRNYKTTPKPVNNIIQSIVIGVATFVALPIICLSIIHISEEVKSRRKTPLLPCVLLVLTWTIYTLTVTAITRVVAMDGLKRIKASLENSDCLSEQK